MVKLLFLLQKQTGSKRICSFSQMSVYVNGNPYGGATVVTPSTGLSLDTTFNFYATGWLTVSTSYPLYYSFSYQLDTSQAYLTVAALSQLTYTQSELPAGLESRKYVIAVYGSVQDNFYAVANASTIVTVKPNKNLDISTLLSTQSMLFDADGNLNTLYKVVNNVATTMNTVNCSASPDCASLNRAGCHDVPNNCGSCLHGYKGIVGSSNSKCFNSTSTEGSIGSNCESDNDCLYGHCSNTTSSCVAPLQLCPTNIIGSICSGHGDCEYFDSSSGSRLSVQCTIFDVRCTASCVCVDGYGGEHCSLNSTQLITANNLRQGTPCTSTE